MAPDSDASRWDPLDIVLYKLAGKYQPWHEGDKILVKYHDSRACDTRDLLWRYKERGTLRVNPGTGFEPFVPAW